MVILTLCLAARSNTELCTLTNCKSAMTIHGQHIPQSEQFRVKCRYCYLFAPATEHSGWQREAGWLSGLLGLVPGQCQPLEAPVRAPCVAPACGLTQDETCLQTKTGYVSSNLGLVKCFWLRQELKALQSLSSKSKHEVRAYSIRQEEPMMLRLVFT